MRKENGLSDAGAGSILSRQFHGSPHVVGEQASKSLNYNRRLPPSRPHSALNHRTPTEVIQAKFSTFLWTNVRGRSNRVEFCSEIGIVCGAVIKEARGAASERAG